MHVEQKICSFSYSFIMIESKSHVSSRLFSSFHYAVGVLMSCKVEIIQSWSVSMDCQFVMARHSVQTDKLLCCHSCYQMKQIVRVINCKVRCASMWYLFHYYIVKTLKGVVVFPTIFYC